MPVIYSVKEPEKEGFFEVTGKGRINKSFQILFDVSEKYGTKVIKEGTKGWYNLISEINNVVGGINYFITRLYAYHPLLKAQNENRPALNNRRGYTVFCNNMIVSYIKERFYLEKPKGLEGLPFLDENPEFPVLASLLWVYNKKNNPRTIRLFEETLSKLFYSVSLLLAFAYSPLENKGRFLKFKSDKATFECFNKVLRDYKGKVEESGLSLDEFDSFVSNLINFAFEISREPKKENASIEPESVIKMYTAFINEESWEVEPLSFILANKVRKLNSLFMKARTDWLSLCSEDESKLIIKKFQEKLLGYIEKNLETYDTFYSAGRIDFYKMYAIDSEIIGQFYEYFKKEPLQKPFEEIIAFPKEEM